MDNTGRYRAMALSTLIGRDIPPNCPPPSSKNVEPFVFVGTHPGLHYRKLIEDGIKQYNWWDIAGCYCDDAVAEEEEAVLL